MMLQQTQVEFTVPYWRMTKSDALKGAKSVLLCFGGRIHSLLQISRNCWRQRHYCLCLHKAEPAEMYYSLHICDVVMLVLVRNPPPDRLESD